jgi:hypothetical protein
MATTRCNPEPYSPTRVRTSSSPTSTTRSPPRARRVASSCSTRSPATLWSGAPAGDRSVLVLLIERISLSDRGHTDSVMTAGECTFCSTFPPPRYMWTPHGRHGSKLRTARMMSIPLKFSGEFSSKIGVFWTASS